MATKKKKSGPKPKAKAGKAPTAAAMNKGEKGKYKAAPGGSRGPKGAVHVNAKTQTLRGPKGEKIKLPKGEAMTEYSGFGGRGRAH